MTWVRLWCDMPTDPKWRVISKKSGRPISEVVTIFTAMMANAGANAFERSERGTLVNWSDEDTAAAFDMETEHVVAIREAMQGKTLDGARLKGWEKRQPKREDNSAERAKAWRERKRTQANAEKRPDTDTDTDTESTPLPPEGACEDQAEPVILEGGNLKLNNKLWITWLEIFGNDKIRLLLALREVGGRIQPNSTRPLEAQVSSQLARIAGDKRDRDSRYESAVKTNGSAAPAQRPKNQPVNGGVAAELARLYGPEVHAA